MCGIFAVAAARGESVQALSEKLLAALSALEYRGYDSAGILMGTTESDSVMDTHIIRAK
ncbi:hypothetical protein KIPB_012291, partial [Kipferlia bialata]|eukprot:g12291.t1